MKKLLLAALAILGTYTATAQKTINGVSVEKSITVSGQELELNGAGMREKLWYDLYVGALYLTEKSSDGKALLNADKAMAITLDITDEAVTQDKMKSAVEDGFDDSCSSKERKAIQKEINTFIGFFKDAIVKGDHFEIAYLPGKGTMVSKNGTQIGTIAGLNFKKGLFGIWLGDDPADEDLKEGMLNK
ncbi:chalcone isomerase [Nonlabens dokdonensis]|uniref:Chalcone isomerase n=1 Tax=Nonlabens dokdonensis TaxID=328515 RepID=A0A1Z8AKF1_9FLAO|nr:chalcone isomerase family protein [Nonlabens dokdonensis]OUS10826.1 chalcone isomerase [Nonlabens dokdonensis]